MPKSPAAERVPNSWSVEDWPPSVYPGKPSKGRYICRTHRDELVAGGALTRIGRDLVVIGANYSAWLSRGAGRVAGFPIAPNASRASK